MVDIFQIYRALCDHDPAAWRCVAQGEGLQWILRWSRPEAPAVYLQVHQNFMQWTLFSIGHSDNPHMFLCHIGQPYSTLMTSNAEADLPGVVLPYVSDVDVCMSPVFKTECAPPKGFLQALANTFAADSSDQVELLLLQALLELAEIPCPAFWQFAAREGGASYKNAHQRRTVVPLSDDLRLGLDACANMWLPYLQNPTTFCLEYGRARMAPLTTAHARVAAHRRVAFLTEQIHTSSQGLGL